MDTEQIKQAVGGVFSRSAAAYGQVGPSYFQHFGQQLVNFARITPGARVLDVACGRGAVLFPAAEAASPGGLVTGVDLSAGMVSETSRDIAERSVRNARVVHMDAENLQFPDASFDTVLCGFALFFFPRLDQALAEMHRVLVPGGQIAVSTWGKYDERWEWLGKLIKKYLPDEPDPGAMPGPQRDFKTPPASKPSSRAGGSASCAPKSRLSRWLTAARMNGGPPAGRTVAATRWKKSSVSPVPPAWKATGPKPTNTCRRSGRRKAFPNGSKPFSLPGKKINGEIRGPLKYLFKLRNGKYAVSQLKISFI